MARFFRLVSFDHWVVLAFPFFSFFYLLAFFLFLLLSLAGTDHPTAASINLHLHRRPAFDLPPPPRMGSERSVLMSVIPKQLAVPAFLTSYKVQTMPKGHD